ncbi:alpha/beta hydrolase [Streptomyces sp. NBC_00038]|uniref:alpha/beta hydrolase n=1 Tax=Streptomyces sp. NBC_00038 TaxID=2903615 RepID=UPI00225B998B|nr:alpha/beta hydrolase [Streptomyces sp. NBC_00038]MCX5563035.1 alpha/beta hydrolase [Streptomyces sp. NBC_00038]
MVKEEIKKAARNKKPRRAGMGLATAVVLGLALTACSSDSGSTAADASASKSTECPASQASGAAAGQAGSGAPSGAAGGASLSFAKTVKASDTSTSTVIDPTGAQIQCGKVEVATHSDVVYSTPTANGKKAELKLDLQVPETDGKKPLVVYMTGGGFAMADKTGNLNQRTYVAEQGYAVASIEYRTVTSGATYTETLQDVKSAIRYLRAHADEYGIDPANVAVWGQSAGGYLAAMTGTTNGVKEFEAGENLDQSSDVQAVVDEFGPGDLSKTASDFDAATQKTYLAAGTSSAQFVFGAGTKKSLDDDPKAIQAADPSTYADSSDPAFMLLHGSDDRLVSPSQTLTLHNTLRAKGVDSTRYVLEGADHGDLSFMGGDSSAGLKWSTEQVMGDIVTFLGKHLGS